MRLGDVIIKLETRQNLVEFLSADNFHVSTVWRGRPVFVARAIVRRMLAALGCVKILNAASALQAKRPAPAAFANIFPKCDARYRIASDPN
jgi:hypothetical protein